MSPLIVYRQKFQHLPWRCEPLHVSLSSSRRLVRILRSIVQPLVLAMFDTKAHVLARCAVGFEVICDPDAWRSPGLLQQLSHEPLRGAAISPALDEDVENKAILIDGAQCFLPAIVITTSSRCHLSPRTGARRRMRLENSRPNFSAQQRIVFMADDDPARSQYFFDHPRARRKPKIQPNGVAEDLGREAMATIEWVASMGMDRE
jgi:hypothetical protein